MGSKSGFKIGGTDINSCYGNVAANNKRAYYFIHKTHSANFSS